MDWQAVGYRILGWWQSGGLTQAALIVLAGWLLSYMARWLFSITVARLAGSTQTDLDDKIVAHALGPVGHTVQLMAAWQAAMALHPTPAVAWGVTGLLGTLAIGTWTISFSRISHELLEWLVEHSGEYAYVNRRTLPVFDFAATAFVWGGAAFMVCQAWDIDTTGWLASAGVVGVAVGFASQETLGNLIAGVFILADAPYKLGDFLDLGNGTRGKVIEIGIRTTRLVTPENVEIIVPNSLMASSQITNQSGGPSVRFRVSVEAGVGYGSDVDQVRDLLMDVCEGVRGICPSPKPQVRFSAMADSALVFTLNVWVEEPGLRETVIDQLNTRIYKRLVAEGIEIPFPKQDVYMYPQAPQQPSDSA